MKSILVVLLFAVVASATKVDYSGHMVIRVVPETQEQLDHLLSMQRNEVVDFWAAPSFLGKAVDLRVSPESYYHTARRFAKINLAHTIRFTDIGKMMEEEMKSILLRRATHSGKAFDLENYHTYDEIVSFMKDLAVSNSNLVSTTVIGTTYEGQEIVMATVSTSSASTKPIIYFDCAMHAREWASTSTCIWTLNELATKYGKDAQVTELVDRFDWLITPVGNPDGYRYTWTTDRQWRKNREPNAGSPCNGTDPNRNFAVGFGGAGASNASCAITYHGPEAFSTLEARAMRDILDKYGRRVISALTIHTYSQFWMSPYGYKQELPKDYTEMYRAMKIGADAITATYGTKYTYGNIYDVIYQCSGCTSDYTYDIQGIPYSYSLELRDTGLYGFELPANQILPTAIETFNGIKAFANAVYNGPFYQTKFATRE